MKYISLIINVFRDVLADKTRRRISQDEISVLCDDLSQIIRNKYEPDRIIAIDTGGSMPGELISQKMSIPITHIVVSRHNKITRRYNNDPIPLRWAISIYHHFLFQTTRPRIFTDADIEISGKKILVVDDTIHTGATIDIVIKYLKQANVSEIKVATLAYILGRKPDFSVLPPGNYCFPWSRDYNDPEV